LVVAQTPDEQTDEFTQFRVWRCVDGREVIARLVAVDREFFTLEKESGQTIRIELDRLDKFIVEDRQLVQRYRQDTLPLLTPPILSRQAEGVASDSSKQLLYLAKSLNDEGEHSVAVIVAHMACEIAVERVLSESLSTSDMEALRDLLLEMLNGYDLGNQRLRHLYNALGGDLEKQLFWPSFEASARRRNRIVHSGKIVSRAEAGESYQAATQFVAYLASR
jgi:hypothetical protein